MPQLEGPITKIYNYVLGAFREKKQGKKKKKAETFQIPWGQPREEIDGGGGKRFGISIRTSMSFNTGQAKQLRSEDPLLV